MSLLCTFDIRNATEAIYIWFFVIVLLINPIVLYTWNFLQFHFSRNTISFTISTSFPLKNLNDSILSLLLLIDTILIIR